MLLETIRNRLSVKKIKKLAKPIYNSLLSFTIIFVMFQQLVNLVIYDETNITDNLRSLKLIILYDKNTLEYFLYYNIYFIATTTRNYFWFHSKTTRGNCQ